MILFYSDDNRSHGIVSGRQTISVDLKNGKTKISPTADNAAVIDNLRDQNALLTNKFLPLVKKWTVTLTKAGDNADSDALKRAIDVKQLLEEVDARVKDLGIDLKRKDREAEDSDSDGDRIVSIDNIRTDTVTINPFSMYRL